MNLSPKSKDSLSPGVESDNTPDMSDVLDLDPKELNDKVFWFERGLDRECHTYGWGRGLRKACSLYKENLELENRLEKKNKLIQDYKNRIEELRMHLECKTPKIINSVDLDGLGLASASEESPGILE